jgi:hypothetical protein
MAFLVAIVALHFALVFVFLFGGVCGKGFIIGVLAILTCYDLSLPPPIFLLLLILILPPILGIRPHLPLPLFLSFPMSFLPTLSRTFHALPLNPLA